MRRILLLLLWPAVLFAQNASKALHYEQYTTINGLNHNHVYRTFQDSRGVLWVITETALNRFDGRTFKPIPQVKITYPVATRIYLEDKDGDLWIGDYKGSIFCLNIHTEKVMDLQQKFSGKLPEKITGALKRQDGSYLLRTAINEISLFHPNAGVTRVYRSDKGVLDLIGETKEGTVWLEENYWFKGGQYIALNTQLEKQQIIAYHSSISHSRGILEGNELYYFTNDSFFVAGKSGIEKCNSIRAIYPEYRYEDPESTGYYNVSGANPATNEIVLYSRYHLIEFDQQFQLSYDLRRNDLKTAFSQVFHIYIDGQGFIWLSTFEGLFKVWFTPNRFHSFLVTSSQDQKTIEPKSCRSITQGPDGRIYVAADRCLYKLSGQAGESLVCRPTAEGPIWDIYNDGQGNLWYKDIAVRRYSIRENKEYNGSLLLPLPQSTAWMVQRIGDRLWVGNPLGWVDIRDNSYHLYEDYGSFPEARAHSIYDLQEAGGNLWSLNEAGLYKLNAQYQMVERYWSGGVGVHYLPCDDFRHLYQESDTSWWFATASGLLHLNPQTHHYRLYTTADGLPNNKCHAVIPDENGCLWVSSDNGIIQFEKSTGRLRVYYESDGLELNEFNRLSYYKDTEGRLYFGGINGGVSFHPDEFAKAFDSIPHVRLVVTECNLSGNGLEKSDLRAAYARNGMIEVDPSYPFLQMRFALTDYDQSSKTVYRYKVDDAEAWQEMRDGELELAGLSYGAHTLHVEARTIHGFTAPELQIQLSILRPFYLKWWFLIIVLGALCGSGWTVYRKARRAIMPGQTARQGAVVVGEASPLNAIAEPEKRVEAEGKVLLQKQEDVAFLERLENLVRLHMGNAEFDASALSKAIGISPSQLHRRITTLTGLSTGRYIYSVRLKEAMVQIVSTNMTISEIAYRTGFADPAYFTRLFTKMYQHPPSYFRENGR